MITLEETRRIAEDIRRQPAWRRDADIACDYYDGHQIDSAIAKELEERGMGPLITNLVKPTVNALLGMEAKQRTDWRVYADDDNGQEIAEALSVKLKEAERESRADQACSEAYSGQVKAGLHWVEVGRNPNPFGYRYRVEPVHRREIYWDWSARKPDLSDARYLVRERWYPIDQVASYFPGKADIIKAAGSGWEAEWRMLAQTSDDLLRAFDQESRSGWLEDEWRNQESKLVQVREIWYRTFVTSKVIRLPNGKVVEFDPNNEAHFLGVASGQAQIRKAVISRVRVSIWVGPHMLQDVAHIADHFPYVPFWGYREDKTNIPYGVIRDMIPMQDEVNARRRKLLWLLSSKRVMADSDALDKQYNDMGDLVREIARPDAVVVLNPQRTNASGITVETDLNLSTQQYQVMQESEDAIQKVAGIYNTMMGRADGATSGTAINSLVEQGANSVGDINDNYRYARAMVGERLLDLIIEDLSAEINVVIAVGEGVSKKQITVNQPAIDPTTGIEFRRNDISRVTLKVALSDVPSTPAYRQQQMVQIGEVLKSMPPQLQAALVPYYLEATDLPKRQEMADNVRKMLGMAQGDGQNIPPEVQQQIQQGMALIQQLQEENAQLQQVAQGKAQDAQVKVQIAEMDKQAKEQIAAMQQQLDRERMSFDKLMRVAEMKAAKERAQLEIEADLEKERMRIEADLQAKRETAAVAADTEHKRIAADVLSQRGKPEDDAADAKEDKTEANQIVELVSAMQKQTGEMAQAFTKALTQATGPKKVVRDEQGNLVGVEPA